MRDTKTTSIKISKDVKDDLLRIKRARGMRNISDVIRWSMQHSNPKREFKQRMSRLSDEATLELDEYGVVFQAANVVVATGLSMPQKEAVEFALGVMGYVRAYKGVE